jgi:rhodanese-related sulfurtransferase
MAIRTIPPAEAARLLEQGATLIDIRSPDEHARARIAGAQNIPLEQLSDDSAPGEVIIFHCRSGMRTAQAADRLAEAAGSRNCYIVEGGLTAWGSAGLPIIEDRRAPIEMQRQVMITAGLLILTGTLLSLWVSPAWIWLAVFVGAGLTFAGLTGFCGMARLLALMPWNRRPANG